MRHRKHLIDIKEPFSIIVERASDGMGWIGKIIGLPCGVQVTCADTPENVTFMVWDILRIITGRCSVERVDHEYTIDTAIGTDDAIPAWGCANCDLKTAKSEFVDEGMVH